MITGESHSGQIIAEPAAQMLYVRTLEAASAFSTGAKTMIHLFCPHGEVPFEVNRKFRQPLPQAIFLGTNFLEKVIPFILVETDPAPHLGGDAFLGSFLRIGTFAAAVTKSLGSDDFTEQDIGDQLELFRPRLSRLVILIQVAVLRYHDHPWVNLALDLWIAA
jgi:hypothetical protein